MRPPEERHRVNGFVIRVKELANRRLGDGIARPADTDEQKALHATTDYLLGALHSLNEAHRLDFVDRPDIPPACESIQSIAGVLEAGVPIPQGQWLAGYYFNSALVRMSAVFHRSLKIKHHQILSTLKVNQLDPTAQKTWPDLWSILEEVNDLKHDAAGCWEGRTVRFTQALAAMDKLIEILEGWDRSHPTGP